ncbi:MAG: hypothetical protein Fur0034_12840 [Desulfuromonadia bacterium]
MSERELELLRRIEELERHAVKNGAILRVVAMISVTVLVGIVIATGVPVRDGVGTGSAPAWNTMWFYGLIAASAVSMFWTTHRE